MIGLFIFGIVTFLIGTILLFNFNIHPIITSYLISVGSYIISVPIWEEFGNKPSAIDVYRGNTTLKITYKDNVAIDSVVVFKDKEK